MSNGKVNRVSGHGWRWHVAVATVLLLGLVFIVLGFILIMDPNWAYRSVQPVQNLQPIK